MFTDEIIDTKMASPKRRKKKKRKKRELFDFPGVRKIVMSELTQKIVECIVGEHVTSESPWKYVRKELIQDNLELHEESSEFLPLKKEILEFPRNKILIGYIADETQDKDDEFYICVTEDATDRVEKIIEQLRQDQKERLFHQLHKNIHAWQSMGTEVEVDECIIKNNRPLIEVELETQYPIFPGKVQFRILPVEKKRDGYMELKYSMEENLTNIIMKRIDSAIQVAPFMISTEAQTICTYPKNAATQYLYDVGTTDVLSTDCASGIITCADKNMGNLSDLLKVNGTINFYANDFDTLVNNNELTSTMDRNISCKELIEYLSFMDVKLCKGKMISDVNWHQMWTGTVAVAYCDISPNIFYVGPRKDDEVHKAVHTVNLVLVWSLMDALRPKLILESPREVTRLSFCKFDENVLVGGCRNGQIIIWDIRNKLQKVEEKEVLTTAQQKYRSYMNSLMGWMKSTHDIAVIRPTAISDLKYSHKDAITGVSWINPYTQFSRTGNVEDVVCDEHGDPKYSMQLITSSVDGSILIWDLKDKPVVHSGGYKPKKLKRLKNRPSALMVDISPYRILHLNLKPIYRINVSKESNKNKPISITRSTTAHCRLKYVEVNPELNRKFDIRTRIIYKPIFEKPTRDSHRRIKIGTSEGEYAEVQWEGQDYDSGETVNCEQAKFIFDAKYHDGPITSIDSSICYNVTLTVGGKIFALWSPNLPNRPILWRRSRHFYTMGWINVFQPFRIVLLSVTGVVSRWILPLNSKISSFSQVLSNSFLSAGSLHPFQGEKNMCGIGDEQGAFRIFCLKQTSASYSENLNKAMKIFIDREINRKKLFLKWQDEFNKRNESDLQRLRKEVEEKAKEESIREGNNDETKAPEKNIKKGPQSGKFVEWIMEQRKIKEEARIKAMIINKKQLDTKELEKRRKPLQKLDEENERKKRKQKERLKQGENIFRHTVASLFPDVMKEKPPPSADPYAGGTDTEDHENCYMDYQELSEKMDLFIWTNPLQYEFSFKNLLVASRGKEADYFRCHRHQRRYMDEKKVRKRSESKTEKQDAIEDSLEDEETNIESQEDPNIAEKAFR